ncbi:hypothetical protein SARC_01040 [Sphaeroforma arctica JP610]|uniref:Uncharacterized protein n=1 Tax=Sphaeroforma arctica JP610 TaxID=667725 RepID=A0A0L0GCV3_9EUKA|nr:hypothetical protein SARC_01040 [Sphaeroforma arctica JP610]KNC86847.1 hypothetical protein SARC_01040 [Sphaeroforma arctica JP610]|eukprot:XP_014160749.1 hypothetical protein SARC_01040 [Sphaeroforma arctica JP610]
MLHPKYVEQAILHVPYMYVNEVLLPALPNKVTAATATTTEPAEDITSLVTGVSQESVDGSQGQRPYMQAPIDDTQYNTCVALLPPPSMNFTTTMTTRSYISMTRTTHATSPVEEDADQHIATYAVE